MLSKKGQTLGIAVATSLFLIVAGMLMLNFLIPEIDNVRTNLDCSSPEDISDGTKLFCIAVAGTVPYWIIIIFSLAIGVITARLFF